MGGRKGGPKGGYKVWEGEGEAGGREVGWQTRGDKMG